MTAARSRRAGRGRKVTQEIKRGTTRTGAKKAREFAKKRAEDYAYFSPHMGPIKPKPKAAQTGTSRKAMRDAPKPEREVKRGTTRTAAAKARSMQGPNPEGAAKRTLEPKAPQTGTSRKARRDAPKPKQEIKRGTTRTRQPRVEKEVVPGTTRVRKAADGSKKSVGGTASGIMLRDPGVKPKQKTKPKPSSGKTSSSAASKPTTSAKPSAASKTEKKKDKEKKTLFGLEVKPSSRFAGRGGKRRRVAGRAMGGMMKSKMASKGGAKGGRMPTGMKAGGPASKFPDLSGDGKVTQKDILMGKGVIKKQAGGMMKSKMSSKGGAKGGRMPGGMQAGGMMKSKMSSKGGAKGGRMPGGMKNGGMAKKGPKGYAKGGAMTKKGMAKGGTNKKRAVSRKPRGVGAALRGFGKALKK